MPRPGGPASSTWSSASPRCLAASMNTVSWSLTACWPTKSASRRGRSERSSSSSGPNAGAAWMRSTPGVLMPPRSVIAPPSAPRRSAPRACRPRPRPAARRPPAALKPRPSKALTREAAWIVVGPGDDDLVRPRSRPPTFSRSSTMMRSAVRLPMPGTAWKRALSPAAIALQQLAGGAAGQDRQRHLGADALHSDQQQEQLALLLAREAVQVHAVVAHRRGGCGAASACPPLGPALSVSADTARR